ncbi:hypothetical protein NZ47_12065 [Anaerovibrio lipolyticus]|uniref:Conjugal transfer protein TrbJ n=1 Tax=Anaerovibrio lipolyticus TaxID=82374 RepID=A0A0B2JVK8_9FIRM|nr:hypothetical protein [Anaerovibrio lipolyticus]KHM50666.1 hypothetical protein NZ47_12065 [Anaerovibrio lipolyticus]
MFSTRLKKLLALGAVTGIVGGGIMMVPVEKDANAAIVVMDEQNIAEAIKTAITTATMLDQQTKQLLLEILNTKSLSAEQLARYVQNSQDANDDLNCLGGSLNGVLKPGTSPLDFYKNQIGDVEAILNGNKTLGDVYFDYQRGMNAANQVNMDAAKIAKDAQMQTEKEIENLAQAVEGSAKAEGQLQAIQAGNEINAIATRTAMRNSNTLGGLIAILTTKQERELVDEAYYYKLHEDTVQRMKNYVK